MVVNSCLEDLEERMRLKRVWRVWKVVPQGVGGEKQEKMSEV